MFADFLSPKYARGPLLYIRAKKTEMDHAVPVGHCSCACAAGTAPTQGTGDQ